MTFQTYIRLLADRPDMPDESIAAFKKHPLSIGAEERNLQRLLNKKMRAVHQAPYKGRWPVILLLGSTKGYYWVPTAERLAAPGFVVAAIPSMRYPVDELSVIRRTINVLAKKPYADTDHIGVLGYSTGGVNALLLQMNSPKVKAVLTLEGADTQPDHIRIANHQLFEKHPLFQSVNRQTPLCVIYSGRGSYGRSTGYSTNFSFYDEVVNPCYLVEVHNLHHEEGRG